MTERQQLLTEALESCILVIDGSMGQLLQLHMTAADYGGVHLENLTDYIVKTRPDVHKQYIEAGADIIETNTFNGTRPVLRSFTSAMQGGRWVRPRGPSASPAA